MTRTSKSKRTLFPRRAEYATQFIKDWDRLLRSGRYDMNVLKKVMLMLIANEGPLDPEWKDHQLDGNLAKYRECHVGGDLLLMYNLDDGMKPCLIVFVRAGTHSELLKR